MSKRNLVILSFLFLLLGCSSIGNKGDLKEDKENENVHPRFIIERSSR